MNENELNELDAFIKKFGKITESYWFYDNTIELRYDVKDHVYFLVTPDGLVRQDGVTTICHTLDKSKILIPWGCKMMAQKFLVNSQKFYNNGWYTFSQNDLEETIRIAKSAHKDKLEDAGEVGHKAHNWIEQHIKSCLQHHDDDTAYAIDIPRGDERVANATTAAILWMINHKVRWLCTERKVYSRTHCYAGTMDGLAFVDSCDDPKCCRQPFKDHLAIIDWKTSNFLYIEYLLQTAAYKQAYQEETGESIEDIFIIRLGKEDGEFESWHVDEEMAAQALDAFQRALQLNRSMAILEQIVEDDKDDRKALLKAEKAAQKAAQLAERCKGADTYKGVRKPACNGGNPCKACLAKYEEARKERLVPVKPKVSQIEKPLVLEPPVRRSALQSLQKLLDQ